jgi:hypothetical protein
VPSTEGVAGCWLLLVGGWCQSKCFQSTTQQERHWGIGVGASKKRQVSRKHEARRTGVRNAVRG